MKKGIGTVIALVFAVLALTGCVSAQATQAFRFGEDLAFTEHNGNTQLNLEESSQRVREKHQRLSEILKDIDTIEHTIALTTTTANILWQAGILPMGAPNSKSLLPELQQKQYTPKQGQAPNVQGVLDIGSALTPNTEAIIECAPKLVLYSDALGHTQVVQTLKDAGLNVEALGQSDYLDMFVLLDVLGRVYQNQNEALNNLMTELVLMLKQIDKLVDANKLEAQKTAAVIQLAGESVLVNGDQSVLGGILNSLGVRNVFAASQNTELNQEALIEQNPDYIFYYSHGMGESEQKAFEQRLHDQSGSLYVLDAVQQGRAFAVQDESFHFAASVDLDILKVIRFLAEKVYQ